MFPNRGFAGRYFPGRYFPHGAGAGAGSGFLTAHELSWLRTGMTEQFPSRAFLRRSSSTDTDQGGQVTTWSDVTTVACRLRRWTALEEVEAGRWAAVDRWTIDLPHGTDVRVLDQLRLDGEDYEITGVDAPRSDSICLQLPVRRIQ